MAGKEGTGIGSSYGDGLCGLEEAGSSGEAGVEEAKESGKGEKFSKVGVAGDEGLEQIRVFWILTTSAFGSRGATNHDTEF